MNLHHLPFSSQTSPHISPLEDFNVVIETPANTNVKYEICKETGALLVDRLLPQSVKFPVNYGYVPQTLCDDGDALDVMVYMPGYTLDPKSVIRCRPLGVMYMTDESGIDNKILAVPISSVWKVSGDWGSIDDIHDFVRSEIVNFFNNYKTLIPGKWACAEEKWGDHDAAIEELKKARTMYAQGEQLNAIAIESGDTATSNCNAFGTSKPAHLSNLEWSQSLNHVSVPSDK